MLAGALPSSVHIRTKCFAVGDADRRDGQHRGRGEAGAAQGRSRSLRRQAGMLACSPRVAPTPFDGALELFSPCTWSGTRITPPLAASGATASPWTYTSMAYPRS